VVLTAVITSLSSGVGAPTGTVTFKGGSGGQVIGVGSISFVNGQYVATLSVSNLALGAHAILATYSGDSNFQTSTSGAISVTIIAPTSTALSANVSSVVANQSFTLTAVVSSLAPASGNPTGTVNFYSGSTLIGSVALSQVSGQAVAKLVTSFSTSGTYSLTAVYSGPSSFAASTSSALTETVN
jgi:hypothetical protein